MSEELQNLSILVVEDNEDMLALSMSALDGYKKTGAMNARVGFQKFKALCPDITFLDIGLPDKSGIELLSEILGHDPEAFVVMLTASKVASDVSKAKEIGAAGYIVKPFSRKKIRDYIMQHTLYKKRLAALSAEERSQQILQKLCADIDGWHDHDGEPKEVKKISILFVDDHRDNCRVARKSLKKIEGCDADVAESGEEAIILMQEKHYQLVFLDSDMPDMSGYKAAMKMREAHAETYIVAMIEDIVEVKKHYWEKAGMNEYVLKPVRFSRLEEIIAQCIKEEA